MQVSKSIGGLLAAAVSLGNVAATQAQEISIRPLPSTASSEPVKTEALALAVPTAATSNPSAPQPLAVAAPATATPTKTGGLAVPVAATANPQAAALPIQQVWTLAAGITVEENFKAWAEKAQWRVDWRLPNSWVVPNTTTFAGSFDVAAEKVITTLADNGALVRIGIFEGNKTIVVSGPGLAQQPQQ